MTISVPNQISLTFFSILQGTIQVFRGGCWRLLDPDGIRSPWKNVQLYAWISDQKTGKPHLSISEDSSNKSLVCVSLLSITMMCLSPPYFSLYSFLLALQFLCLFSVKAADEREMLSSRYTEQIQSFPSTSLSYMCSRKQSSMAIYDDVVRQTGKRNNDWQSPITTVPQNSWNDWPSLSEIM